MFNPRPFVHPGFHVKNAVQNGAITIIMVRHTSKSRQCPGCATIAERVHSDYLRRLADLPLAGRKVRLIVIARDGSDATLLSVVAQSPRRPSIRICSPPLSVFNTMDICGGGMRGQRLRAMDRRPSQRFRALAASEEPGIPGMFAGCFRMGWTAASGRES